MPYKFSPGLVPTLATAVVFTVMVGLGLWQMERADEKRAIEAEVQEAQSRQSILINEALDQDLQQMVYRTAIAAGSYDTEHQFLHDNKTHQGKPGYHVLTPLVLQGKGKAILVNRGWIPYQGQRDNIQDIMVARDNIEIRGAIKIPGKSILLEKEDLNKLSAYPQTIQAIALGSMAKQLGYELLPIMLELDKDEANGYVRDWQPFYGSVGKHTGYAVQWFLMAAILLFLYIKINTTKVK